MKRLPLRILSLTTLFAAAACSTYHDVGLTTSEAVVAGCQKVGDIAVKDGTSDADVHVALSNAARAKGANYVLVSADGAKNGTAYSCQGPKVATK